MGRSQNPNYIKAEVTVPDNVRILLVENHIGDVKVTGEYNKVCMDTTSGAVMEFNKKTGKINILM